MKKPVGVALLLVLLWSYPVLADTVILDPGTTNQTTALTGFSTTGSMMSGMKITAYFVGGSSEIATWMTTGAGTGGAFGTGWSLVESGDTFGGTWTLTTGTNAMARLLIEALSQDSD